MITLIVYNTENSARYHLVKAEAAPRSNMEEFALIEYVGFEARGSGDLYRVETLDARMTDLKDMIKDALEDEDYDMAHGAAKALLELAEEADKGVPEVLFELAEEADK